MPLVWISKREMNALRVLNRPGAHEYRYDIVKNKLIRRILKKDKLRGK